jgi:hypothetical protein
MMDSWTSSGLSCCSWAAALNEYAAMQFRKCLGLEISASSLVALNRKRGLQPHITVVTALDEEVLGEAQTERESTGGHARLAVRQNRSGRSPK